MDALSGVDHTMAIRPHLSALRKPKEEIENDGKIQAKARNLLGRNNLVVFILRSVSHSRSLSTR